MAINNVQPDIIQAKILHTKNSAQKNPKADVKTAEGSSLDALCAQGRALVSFSGGKNISAYELSKKYKEYHYDENLKLIPGMTDEEFKEAIKELPPLEQEFQKVMRHHPWTADKTFYRVIGEDELKSLIDGKTIVSRNSELRYGYPCVDVSDYPYYHEMFFGEPKFRVTFKKPSGETEQELMESVVTADTMKFNEEKHHYQKSSYSIDDIDSVYVWNGDDWKYYAGKKDAYDY